MKLTKNEYIVCPKKMSNTIILKMFLSTYSNSITLLNFIKDALPAKLFA